VRRRFGPSGERAELWTHEIARSIDARINANISGGIPEVSPDGSQVVFTRFTGANLSQAHVLLQSISGAGAERTVFAGEPGQRLAPLSWSPDGRSVLVYATAPDVAGRGLYTLTLEDPAQLTQYVTGTTRYGAAFSPDGKWVAYGEGDPSQIVLRPYPDSATGKWPISALGAKYPVWRGDGKEIYFIEDDRRMMVATVELSPEPKIGTPTPMFEFTFSQASDRLIAFRPYDVTPDGQRFIAVTNRTSEQPVRLVVTVGSQKR
jgi:eukaryotic-like serine/threonine-protein kinase